MMTLRRLSWIVLFCWLCIGCGKSQNDLRKFALRNTSGDDDDDTPSKPARPATAPNGSPSTAATPAVGPAKSSPTSPAPATVTSTAIANVPAPNSANMQPPNAMPNASAPTAVPQAANEQTSAPLADTRTLSPTVTVAERQQQTIDSMRRIMQALEAFQAEKGVYPAPFLASDDSRPRLSWRVLLLPYLGYNRLYSAFHLDEPWDSPHNRALIEHIPSVYQSPERCDTRTNYLLPISTSGAFFGAQGKSPRRWEDGRENTILLLECDDQASVPWTAPNDWTLDPRQPRQHLGQLRSVGFLAGWGGGQVLFVPKEVTDAELRGLFTVDGGESLSATALARDPTSIIAAAKNTDVANVSPSSRSTADPSSPSVSTDATIADAAISTAEDSLLAQSTSAAKAGRIHDALACLYAHSLCHPGATPLEYYWVSGLHRPVAALRFGIGIDYRGNRAAQLARDLLTTGPSSPATKYYSIIGDLGLPIVQACERHPACLPPLIASTASGPTSQTGSPSIQWLGLAKGDVLLRVAQKRFTDLLIVFEVDDKRPRSGQDLKSVRYIVRDVATGKSLLTSARIDYQQREQDQANPLFEDPIDKVTRTWEELLAKQFVPRPLSGKLRKEFLQKRLVELTKRPLSNPLPALCELQFYRQADWVSVSEILTAYQTILGSDDGSTLLAGTPAERRRLANAWIPRATALATSSRAPANTAPESDE